MIAAAKKADAHDFILTLEDPEGRTGYDAHVGERGVKLSGGQRQRVAIAGDPEGRADPDPGRGDLGLDSEAEAAIQDALYGVMEGKTVIAIAHRLSTIAAMDRIVVLEDGAGGRRWPPCRAFARNGLYARFWARQSGRLHRSGSRMNPIQAVRKSRPLPRPKDAPPDRLGAFLRWALKGAWRGIWLWAAFWSAMAGVTEAVSATDPGLGDRRRRQPARRFHCRPLAAWRWFLGFYLIWCAPLALACLAPPRTASSAGTEPDAR
jgi:hypothetical protein